MATVCRPAASQELVHHPVLPQQSRNIRRSKRLTIGEETGQKEQPISDGSDFVSGYSDDSDQMSQGDDNGLVAEVTKVIIITSMHDMRPSTVVAV